MGVDMAKKQKKPEGGANWMDTYGDMVTLLLCFFVLLFSISSVDATKWEIIVRSFNPSADQVSQIVTNTKQNDAENEVEGSMDDKPTEQHLDDFDELYYILSQYVQENDLGGDVEITKGDGFTFITFRNNIFFDGDSYVLKENGKVALDALSDAIYTVRDSIAEIQVLGHTSQASPNEMNEISSDRFLSSNRATVVLVYLQQKNLVDPSKLVSCGYGQFRPISPFDTRESRSRNRRVEILITKNDNVVKTLEDYYKEAYGVDSDAILKGVVPTPSEP